MCQNEDEYILFHDREFSILYNFFGRIYVFETNSLFFIFPVFMSENGWDCVQDHREDIMKCVNSSVPELFNENIKQKYSNIHMLIYSPENCRRGNH